jgi:peptide/nickel transport system permease protein
VAQTTSSYSISQTAVTTQWTEFRALMRRAPALAIGGLVLLLIILFALIGPILTPDPNEQDIRNRLEPPSRNHVFGKDQYGRDLTARMAHGARTTLFVSTSVGLLSGISGLVLGLAAGYFRRIDNVIMRIMDGLIAFPGLLLALGLVAALGPKTSNIIIALSVSTVPYVARLMRSAVLGLREREYATAAKALGAHEVHIIVRHIIPNLIPPFVLQVSFIFAVAILAEAGLSFLGVGTPPEQASWGGILSSARGFINQAFFMTFIPGFAIFITVLSLNFLGDGLQDALDPRLRRRV